MRILVTGSSGRLGSATVSHLQAHGHIVTGADIVKAATTHLQIDITDKQQVNEFVQGYDAVLHTAAIHGKHYELNYPREAFIDTNIYGTLNLLNACVKNGISKFLYVSTTSIYGESLVDNEQAVWVDELLPIKPRDIYDISKQTAEELCRDFFYKEGLQTSVYRVGRFLPEDDNLRINHRLYRGLDERDGAEALRLALNVHFDNFEVFNISSGSPFGVDDLQLIKYRPKDVILNLYPRAERIYTNKGWYFPESIDRVYVCEKAKQLLKYNLNTPLVTCWIIKGLAWQSSNNDFA